MKLSEAIRLGAMLRPQAFGDYTDGVGTCAIGAACEAYGVPLNADTELLPWSELLEATDVATCPVCGVSGPFESDEAFYGLIPHLNDDHRWAREAIADWVETIERAQEPHVPACDSSDVTQGQAETTAVALCAPK